MGVSPAAAAWASHHPAAAAIAARQSPFAAVIAPKNQQVKTHNHNSVWESHLLQQRHQLLLQYNLVGQASSPKR
jgi:hypothetical protein